MPHIELEQRVRKENRERFPFGPHDEANQHTQPNNMLSRELLKLQAMFPDLDLPQG